MQQLANPRIIVLHYTKQVRRDDPSHLLILYAAHTRQSARRKYCFLPSRVMLQIKPRDPLQQLKP